MVNFPIGRLPESEIKSIVNRLLREGIAATGRRPRQPSHSEKFTQPFDFDYLTLSDLTDHLSRGKSHLPETVIEFCKIHVVRFG